MIQKKVCMLGAPGVGKTSLVARFVQSTFSDKYHSTLGVKIDKKTIMLDEQEHALLIWDLAGEDEFATVQTSYLRGTAGCLLVVDGTRPVTLNTAIMLNERATSVVGEVPAILMVNKSDITSEWAMDESMLESLAKSGWSVFRTSAKTGENVEAAFLRLTLMMAQ